MRVLYLTQWFDPEPILKGVSFAKGLADRGMKVEVLTGFPNYPTGKLAPGYRLELYKREEMDGVAVHRVWLFPSHDNSTFLRALNYLSFFVSAWLFCLFKGGRYDLVYVYHPPITAGLAAVFARAFRRWPVIVDIQDLWPDSVAIAGMKGAEVAARLLGPICRYVYSRADRIIAQSKTMADRLVERGVPRAKITTIYNWAEEKMIAAAYEVKPRKPGSGGRFELVFGGNLGRVQGLDALVRAACLAAETRPELQLTLIGDGVERPRLAELIDSLGTSAVRLLPPVPRSEIAKVFAAADGLVIHLLDTPITDATVPSKTQFYMAMGKPILAGVRGEAAAMVESAGAGVVARPGDIGDLASAMIKLCETPPNDLKAMGSAARAAYQQNYAFDAALTTTLAVLREAEPSSH